MRSACEEVFLDELQIRGLCSRCFTNDETIDDVDIRLVSPTGLVHQGRDYGMTVCHRDATYDDWWWAL